MIPRRTDRNHAELVDVLRTLGWHVVDLHTVPCFVDAIAQRAGELRLLEFKADARSPYTAAQMRLFDRGWPIWVLRNLEDCERLR